MIRSKPLARGSFIPRQPIKRIGHMTTLWQVFSAKYAEECRARSEDGLLHCSQMSCLQKAERLDLHHVVGREADPSRYFDKKNLVWLCREHHMVQHGGSQ